MSIQEETPAKVIPAWHPTSHLHGNPSVTKLTIIAIEMILASTVTAMLYRIDKSAARAGTSRIPENTLLLGCLLGGWPGGLWAAKTFRHKTQKVSYRLRLAVAIVVHVAAVAAWIFFL